MYRTIIISIAIAIFLFFTSAYIALRMGALPWPIIFSIITAAGLLKISGGLTRNTVNIAQAGGSIGGLMAAAVVFTLPGLIIDQPEFISSIGITLLSAGSALLGIALSIPLREEYVIKQNLAFPAGRAGGEIIKAGFEGDSRFQYIVIFGLAAALFTLLRDALGWQFINLGSVSGVPILLLIMPMVIGTGFILGPANSLSWGAGGFLSLLGLIIIPMILPDLEGGPNPLLQNGGMGLVIGSGIGYILFHTRLSSGFKTGLKRYNKWVWLLAISNLAILLISGISPGAAILGLALTFIVVNLASRMTGVTNIDPLEQFGLLATLLIVAIFGIFQLDIPLGQRYLLTYFIAIAAAIAGDIGHDYRSAEVVGTDYRKIVRVDIIAALVVAAVVPVMLAVIKGPQIAGQLFTPQFPAPQAQIVKLNLQGLAHPVWFLVGVGIAILIEGLRLKNKLSAIHLMPLGIGLFLGINLALLVAIGGIIALRVNKRGEARVLTGIVISAAILGGEGTIGFLQSATGSFFPDQQTLILGSTGLILVAILTRSLQKFFRHA